MPPLQVVTLATVGGIHGGKADPDPVSYDEADNFLVHRGRMAVRAPLQNVVTVKDSGGGDVDAIVGMCLFNGKLYFAGYDDTLNEVNLYESALDGTGGVHKAVIWNTVNAQPTAVIMTAFTAGASDASEDRIYVCDFDQNFSTRYWNGTVFTTLTRDFDQSTPTEDAVFSYIADYQFHLWGTGFIEGTVARAEFIRFSTPGAIPLTDIVDAASAAWHINDYLQIGRRGNPIMALQVVNQRLLVFQQDATHAINGYDRTSWTVRPLSDVLGAVGPNAVDHYDGKVCFFWTAQGPAMSDGEQVIDITEPIRDEVNKLTPSTKVIVLVDPVQAQAFFFVPSEGNTNPNKYFAYDILNQQWTMGQYLDSEGLAVDLGAGATAVSLGAAASGPAAAPSAFTASFVSADPDGSIQLAWTNGDVAIATVTEIYRHTATFTPGAAYLLATVDAGVDEYLDDGLLGSQTYYYNVRHLKAGQYSAAATEDASSTWCRIPTGSVAKATSGIVVHYENLDDDTADIKIYRRDFPAGPYSLVKTVSSVAPDTPFWWNDFTTTLGEEYQYGISAAVATFSDSLWFETDSEISHAYAPEISDADYNITSDPVKPWIKTIHVTWVVVRGGPHDTVWIYEDSGSGYVKQAEAPLYQREWINSFTCPYAGTNLKYKLEVRDNNTTLVQTEYVPSDGTSRIDPCVAVF